MRASLTKLLRTLALGALVFTLTHCGNQVGFKDAPSVGQLGVCEGISCELTPLTTRASVITILVALGDQVDSQLVVKSASAQLIAETVMRYASPKANPKIALVVDHAAGGESSEDTVYVADRLLARYDVTVLQEPAAGLTAADLAGYDLVWFNNPGAPMGSAVTRDALIAFAGGVILQGDDLSRGRDFDSSALTGLTYVDNGTSVTCGGQAYAHDNNEGYQYRVTLDAGRITGASSDQLGFRYGNDIDNTTPARADLEVLATARGGADACVDERPAIVRYQR